MESDQCMGRRRVSNRKKRSEGKMGSKREKKEVTRRKDKIIEKEEKERG